MGGMSAAREDMDLDRLYRYLQEEPRDSRWLLRKVGMEYRERLAELDSSGRPVVVRMEQVEGMNRAVYRAGDQGELFPAISR